MTAKEKRAAIIEGLKALRHICAEHPESSDGCKWCPLHDWCGTVAPEGISDDEIEMIADIAEREARRQ